MQTKLIDLLRLEQGDVVALVGAGGKSRLMLALFDETKARGWRGLFGTTTRVWVEEGDRIKAFLYARRDGDVLIGVPGTMIDAHMRGDLRADLTVIEADGAAGLPVKAPAKHEPVIPSSTTVVVCTIGAQALGAVINECAFRPELVAAVAGCSPYDRFTPEHAARLMANDEGGRKGVGMSARYVVAICGVTDESLESATELQRLLISREVETVQVPRSDS